MIHGIKNALTYVKGQGFIYTDIRIENSMIADIGRGVCKQGITLPDDAMVLPAFIDLHIHGAAGSDCIDGTVAAIKKIASALAEEGTASFVPTIMTQTQDVMCKAVRSVRQFIEEDHSISAEALGIHLEGPFLSEKYAGGQPRQFLDTDFRNIFDNLNAESGNHIKIVTVAPEVTGKAFIRELCEKGVCVSIGHTDCTYEMTEENIDVGARSVTHTYNAQRGFHHREVGIVGAALLDDRVYCELIADCCHVSVPAMQVLVKCKPESNILLVTDSIRMKGEKADRIYNEGGLEIYYTGKEVRLANGVLAGSVLKMNTALKNMVQKVKVPLEKAILFCTENPAKYLKAENRLGAVLKGRQADFAVLNSEFEVLLTIKKGEIIYKNCTLDGQEV